MKNKKNIIWILVLCLAVAALAVGLNWSKLFKDTEDDAPTDTNDTAARTEAEYEDYLASQTEVDSNLQKELENGYTIDDPMVVVNPYKNSPLTAMVIFTTEETTSVKCVVKGKDNKNNIEVEFDESKSHMLPIYGLYLGDTTEVELTLDDGTTKVLQIQTESIDTVLADAEVTAYEEGQVNSNELTFVSIESGDNGQYGAVAYDNAGDIRWLLKTPEGTVIPLKRLANGNIMIPTGRIIKTYYNSSGLIELDLCGKIYHDYLVEGGEHHDFYELANGNILLCGNASDFSTVEDRIVEIDRTTGEIVYDLDLAELIDPSDGGSINRSDHDWAHTNGLDYDEETDTLILSCRHLDAVLGIDMSDKQLKWILGDPEGWTNADESLFFTPINTENGFEWQFAQHNAQFLEDGDIILFDNGAGRTKTSKEDEKVTGDDVYSRAVRYELDYENMTIEQVWEYGKDLGKEWYSPYISGMSYLGTDTYWITSGANRYDAVNDTYDNPPYVTGDLVKKSYHNQVIEDQLVYELTIPALSYRSIRMSLYPSDYTFDLEAEGDYIGTLGAVNTTDNPSVNMEDAKSVDFELTTIKKTYDRFIVSGTWASTGEDAVLVLVDEEGNMTSFSLTSMTATEDSEMFSVWITEESVEQGHSYDIYLYNNGTLYDTKQYVRYYVNTQSSDIGLGAKYALYDNIARSYQLISSGSLTSDQITTDITTEESAPIKTANIEAQITNELENGGYTFESAMVIQDPFNVRL